MSHTVSLQCVLKECCFLPLSAVIHFCFLSYFESTKTFFLCSLKESGKIRRTVQLGIEKIRAVDERHGLHVQLLIYLGKSFGSKVCTTVNSTKEDKACGSGAESQFVMNRLI